MFSTLLFLVTSLVATSSNPETPREPPHVETELGVIEGRWQDSSGELAVYRGIPYAEPPIEELRWRPPVPVSPWNGTLIAADFGAACPQPPSPIRVTRDPVEQNEDCLSLNVWSPVRADGELLPVMVWIHGGGFTIGAGSLPAYDGSHLASQGVVVVTINYRVGILGFLAHPALSAEQNGRSGNYGLLDQIEALRWVQRHIARFGGDPNRVTIFGESAGAVSVSMLMVSPLAEGLFHGAIAQSGGPIGSQPKLRESVAGSPSAEALGEEVVDALGIDLGDDPLSALRGLPARLLVDKIDTAVGLLAKGTRYRPCIDGWVLPDDPGKLWLEGRQADVPFMAGSNADEATVFLKGVPAIRRPAGYRFMVRSLLGEDAGEVLKVYPPSDDAPMEALSELVADMAFVHPARLMVRSMESKDSPAFLYHFTHASPLMPKLGAFHGFEIAFVFGTLSSAMGQTVGGELIRVMPLYWTNFAKTGDPNGEGLPIWPVYGVERDAHLELGEEIRPGSGLRREGCDLHERLLRRRLGAGK